MMLCVNKNLCQRLAVFQAGCVPNRTAQRHNLQHLIHVGLQLRILEFIVRYRVAAKMHAFRRRRIDAANQIAVNLLTHEGDHRRCELCYRNQRSIKRHIRAHLVIRHPLNPEALPVAPHIPVTQLIHKILQAAGRLWDPVVAQVSVQLRNQAIQFREQPAVHDRQLFRLQRILRRVKFIDIGIEHKERIGIPQCGKKLPLPFQNGFRVEAVRQPRCGVAVEIPTDCICAISFQRLEGVNRVALRL
ncbi:Uncharacterised protein [uncultured Ruminococcus sp.]|nr:Uncharacterised protein [uncultured Ruminococcus sp.]